MRTNLPDYDTPELLAEWNIALATLTRIGELGVERAMGVATRRMIFQVLRAMGAVDVLDIGTCFGTSACTMALAECNVVTVDARPVNGTKGSWRKHGRPRDAKTLMELAGVNDRVAFVTADSVKYMRGTDRLFDFISIDGGHRMQHVYEEIILAQKCLKSNGLIFLDDVQVDLTGGFTPIHGPRMAIERHIAEGAPLRVIHFAKTMYGEPTGVAFLVAK